MSATHDDVAELLGAYALNAVDPDERAVVEAHLETCPRCRAELRDHGAVAALLGNSGGDAPDGLWDRIASTLEESAPPMRLDLPPGRGAVIPLAARRAAPRWSLVAAAAASALVIGALGLRVVRQEDDLDRIREAMVDEGMLRAANLALRDPAAEQAALSSTDGDVTATAVVLPDGSGYLMLEDVPDLAEDRTYQLWGQTGGDLISLGLLGGQPEDVVPFHAAGEVEALAITEEDAPGVVQSSNPPALAGRLT
jgi:anti-sigma factor RsiW